MLPRTRTVIVFRILLIAMVYTHLSAFHIPFIKLLQSWEYEVDAGTLLANNHKEEAKAAVVKR